METNTELGYILPKLNYKDSEVERFDQLAFHLYCIPISERIELLAALTYMFHHDIYDNRVMMEKLHKKFDEILANRE